MMTDFMGVLDERSRYFLQGARNAPFLEAICRDTVETHRARRFMVSVGMGIVQPFAGWLHAMYQDARPGSMAARFLADNFKEEQAHWRWWLTWGKAHDLHVDDYRLDSPEIGASMRALTRHLQKKATGGNVLEAITAVNYVIEQGAAEITGAIPGSYMERLTAGEALWIQVHAKGDVEHSAMARQAMIEEAAIMDESSTIGLRHLVDETYRLFLSALAEAY